MNKLSLFFYLLIGFLSLGQKFEKVENPTALKSKLNTHFQSTKTLKCNFTEQINNPVFEEEIKNNGKMAYNQSGEIRWEVITTTSVLLINKEGVRMAKNGKEITNLQANRMAKRMQTFLFNLMSGNFLDEKKFTVYYYKNANSYRLNLIPKNSRLKKYVSKIKLTFNKKTLLLSTMKMIQSDNHSVEYTFKNIQKNVSLSPSIFNQF